MSLKALVVDDEPLARRSIRRFLRDHSDIEVLEECGNGMEAVTAIVKHKPDMIFLDVQMPEVDGFGVIRQIGAERMPVTVFATAYDRYALAAFDSGAIDYLLKPFSKVRFDQTLQRVRSKLGEPSNSKRIEDLLETMRKLTGTRDYAERIPIADGGRVVFVKTREIQWIESQGNHARIHTKTHCHEVRETLTSLESKLNPEEFARIHRSTIINLQYVKEIHRWFHGYHLVVLEGGHELRMSRYQREVAQKFGLKAPR